VKRLLTSAAVLVALDQASKWLVFRFLEVGHVVPLIGETVRLRHVHNAGAVFGLFQGARLIFVLISIASIALIVYLTLTKRYAFSGSRIAFGLILGGALGNLVDRLWLSQVIDFIDVGFGTTRWPVFNVADIGLTLGVLYLAIRFLWHPLPGTPAAAASPPAEEWPQRQGQPEEPTGEGPALPRGENG